MTSLPQLPPVSMSPAPADDDEFADSNGATTGTKREAESPLLRSSKNARKPRDNRLRDCFTITPNPNDGGGESISCRHCTGYNKTLQKFNPTKAREHLTTLCPGVDEALKQILLSTTQAARRSLNEMDDTAGLLATSASIGSAVTVASSRPRKTKGRNRPSPAYISFHTDDTSLDVTAPIENGELILRLTFPTDHLKLNFNAGAEKSNMEGAALCIDGFMNMKPDASWTASLCSMTSEGTRAGPHCQWSLNPDISGVFEGGMTRVQKVEKLLKVMAMH